MKPPIQTTEISPEILAVLAAAVATFLQGKFRIVTISDQREMNNESGMQQWSIEGRRQIYSSHQLR